MGRSQPNLGWALVPVRRDLVSKFGLKESKSSANQLRVTIIKRFHIWLECPLSEGWIAAYRLAVDRQNERVVVSEVRIIPHDTTCGRPPGEWKGTYRNFDQAFPTKPITKETVRRVRLGHDVHEFNAIISQIRTVDPAFAEYFGLKKHTRAHDARQGSHKSSGRGRPSLPIAHYADVAKRYVDALKRGSGRPLEDVRVQLRLKSTSIAKNRVAKARLIGLLELGTGKGRQGGKLTAKARRILRRSQS